MRKNYGHKYFSKKQKKVFLKRLSFINSLLLIVQISLGIFFIAPKAQIKADNGSMCEQKSMDVVLIIDRSGSMDYASRCDWWQLKCVNPPTCSSGYAWTQSTTYDQSKAWCDLKNQPAPHESVYLVIDPKKIVAAKQAASNFVGLMGTYDQSALVSYANTATLDKGLSNSHTTTQAAINSLTTGGATNIGDAIKLGIDELKSARANAQASHVMILLTDGKANKPNGSGSGENSADVAYAESQAVVAAGYNFRIFTIGLGTNGEINEVMLQNIAQTTGAEYYNAPSQADLEEIYHSIANKVCHDYGSISGCKFSDTDKDGAINGHDKLAGWEIKLNNSDLTKQLTDESGCYKFDNLLAGQYTVNEGGKAGITSQQTYPVAPDYYTLNLAEGENKNNIDFGNYLPICGNQILDSGEACEVGDSQSCTAGDSLPGERSCKTDCTWDECNTSLFCGDGVKNEIEECDGLDGVGEHQSCSDSCTLINLPYCGDSLVNESGEECDNSAPIICTTQSGYSGFQECGAGCVWAECTTDLSCGDGFKDSPEICDDGAQNGQPNYCNSDCTGQTPADCGNGVKEGSEQCDGTDSVGLNQACSAQCTLIELCADNPELCDGLDNNCDGQIDEGYNLGQSCSSGLGACQASGVLKCKQDNSGAECSVTPGAPGEEVCDGIDNNCNGLIDEGIFDIQTYCGAGECASTGVSTCSYGNLINTCQAGTPGQEICDNKDNNCDGTSDEGCECSGTTTRACGQGVGVCISGTQTCNQGQWGECVGAAGPSTEICDNLDNDCDGQTDEDFNLGQSCTGGIGACQVEGFYICKQDHSGAMCNAVAGQPGTEICDGLDNDCDGATDENLSCGDGPTSSADLAITKMVDLSAPQTGQQVTFTINVINNGPQAAANVTVTDALPGGLDFVSASSTVGAYTAAANQWLIGTMADGQTAALEIKATVSASTGTIINQAGVSLDSNIDLNSANNAATAALTIAQPVCTVNCGGNGGGGGSGGGFIDDLTFNNLSSSSNSCGTATVNWSTSQFASSRLVYDIISHPDLAGLTSPDYGYASSTDTIIGPVTGHSIILAGLKPGTTYYLRPVSVSFEEKIGNEVSVLINNDCGVVLGEKITASPEVLGEKITNPEVMVATGFNQTELIWLLGIIGLLLSNSLLIRKYQRI